MPSLNDSIQQERDYWKGVAQRQTDTIQGLHQETWRWEALVESWKTAANREEAAEQELQQKLAKSSAEVEDLTRQLLAQKHLNEGNAETEKELCEAIVMKDAQIASLKQQLRREQDARETLSAEGDRKTKSLQSYMTENAALHEEVQRWKSWQTDVLDAQTLRQQIHSLRTHCTAYAKQALADYETISKLKADVDALKRDKIATEVKHYRISLL
jgi:chromosome segregation ATPase